MAPLAEPVLASALWASERSKSAAASPALGRSSEALRIGVKGIDDILQCSIRSGLVTCMSACPGSGERELCVAIIAAHLLSSPRAVATVIDSVSSFDIRKVHQVVLSHVQQNENPSQAALSVLDRLKIMKVFDFEGLADAVSEFRRSLEHTSSLPAGGRSQVSGVKPSIADSEDEDEALESVQPAGGTTAPESDLASAHAPQVGFLLIDNISQVISPLVKSNYTQGQALLMTFMRSLSHLTKSYALSTLLINSTTSFAKFKEESPSAFASCASRPLLGKSLTHLLDSHLLVHQTPKRSIEATDDSDGELSVIEVIQTGHGEDLGRWVPFTVEHDGRIRQAS